MKERNLWQQLLPDGAHARFFAENAAQIDAENQRGVRLGSLVGLLLTAAALISSCFVPGLAPARLLFWVAAAGCGAAAVLSWAVLRGASGWGTRGVYLFAALTDLFAAVAATVYRPMQTSGLFFLAALSVSVLILDRPLRPVLLTCGAAALFCALTVLVKRASPAVLGTDLTDAVLTLALCVCGGVYVTDLRLKNLQAVRLFQALSETDGLTGLASRAAVEQLCRGYLSAGRAQACALLIVNIDDFNQINESFGKEAGDEVLRRAGEAIRDLFRENDIVGRMGGDEFLILMKNISGPEAVARKADRLLQALTGIMPGGRALECSIGAATAEPGDGVSYAVLLARADTALYGSKSAGKNRCTTYTAAQDAAPAAR